MQQAAQRAISTAVDAVENQGFSLAISQNATDHKSFADDLRMGRDTFPVSTIFDESYCELGPSNFFWLSLIDGQGAPVAGVAARAVDGDPLDLIRTGRLWGTLRPVPVPPTQFVYPEDGPELTGLSAYVGGLY